MREETFLAARTRQRVQAERSPSRQGSSAGGLSGEAFRRSGLRTEPPLAQLEDGTALPPAAVEALLCDAEVQRLVVDPAGQPLDVGLATRSFTADLRVAILRRDRHCQFPQCALRASWCDIHHRRYWSDDGPTSLENGITLCSFHHHRVHAESIWIRAVSGGFVFISRDGRRIGTTTRLHDQILVPQPWPSTDPPPREPRPQKRTPAERERDEWRPGENSAQIWERTSCCDGMERSYVRTGILRNEPEWVSEPGKSSAQPPPDTAARQRRAVTDARGDGSRSTDPRWNGPGHAATDPRGGRSGRAATEWGGADQCEALTRGLGRVRRYLADPVTGARWTITTVMAVSAQLVCSSPRSQVTSEPGPTACSTSSLPATRPHPATT